jgi:hypothetical protein
MPTPWPPHPLTRPRFFSGKLLSADDLSQEQSYQRDKRWLHNRWLHGFGVVRGLTVSSDGTSVHVAPGLAIDGRGEEFVVPVDAAIAVPRDRAARYLVIRYAERETAPVPVGDPDDGRRECSRIEEGFALAYETSKPARAASGDGGQRAVPLARIVCSRGRWRVDRTFRRPRAR